ncbi:MAG: cation transporter [Candidatus Koribacter versatilis]|nr:cation transporter [Candidatus Koribacter versatilis]
MVSTRTAAVHRGLSLEYFTVAWNLLEAVVALISGAVASSIALVGFGLDSLIEVSSGSILLWRLHSDDDEERREAVEQRALKLVGISFLVLAAYVAGDSVLSLVRREAPERSLPGIVLAVVSLIAMPLLARSKRKVASALGSSALQADSRQTDICAYLSAILLVGLLLNAAFEWWWADPVAGMVMVPLIAYEGTQALRGKTCCDDCS